MNKFNETYFNMILEEADVLKNSKIKSVIKEVLTGNYGSIKSLSNGYSFEVLVVKPAIIKDEPKHTKHTDEFKLTFNVENNTLKLKLSYNNKEAEKDIKLSDENKLKSDVEKFIEKQVSSLRVIKEDLNTTNTNIILEETPETYDPDKMTILKNVHPQSFKDMIEDIKKAAEICTDKELKDALKMDLAILKENI